jgi:O-antigen ligase
VQRLLRSVSAAPAILPAAVGIGVIIVGATDEAGYRVTQWAPGALVMLGLLAVLGAALPMRLSDIPRPVLVAVAFLAAFTVWSFATILWADAKGEAWDGANRTLLYLIVFCTFALWPQRAESTTALTVAWIASLAVIAAVTLATVDASSEPLRYFLNDRLDEPAGYANANAALFLMPAWPAVVLSGRAELAWWLRGLLSAAAVLLAGASLVSQSRGSVYALPIVLIVLFAAMPGRVRNFGAMLPVAGAMAIIAPVVGTAAQKIRDGDAPTQAVDALLPTIAACALVAGIVMCIASLIEIRFRSPQTRRAARLSFATLGGAAAVAAVVTGLAFAGNPVHAVRDGWDSFRSGPGEPGPRGRLFSGGLGSYRYDIYRVGSNTFLDHPVGGIGGDNFAAEYLEHRHSAEDTPRYPHSLVLRTLSQTGIIGAILLLGAIGGAVLGGLRAMRRAEPLASVVAVGGTITFVYWLVHGSADWLWEFAGLGAAAWAMVGLACALDPRPAVPAYAPERRRHHTVSAALTVAFLAAAVSLALPWFSQLEVERAARTWQADPQAAYDRLDRAADQNPLSDQPFLVAGTIALRQEDLRRARREFLAADDRNPRSWYAALELGAIASNLDERQPALRWLERARGLNPLDSTTRSALGTVRRGKAVNITAMNRAIRRGAEKVTGRPAA